MYAYTHKEDKIQKCRNTHIKTYGRIKYRSIRPVHVTPTTLMYNT